MHVRGGRGEVDAAAGGLFDNTGANLEQSLAEGCELGPVERHPARQTARDPDRPAHHPARGLRRQPAPAQAHRGGVRLDQDHRRASQDPASRARPGGLDVHTHRRRL